MIMRDRTRTRIRLGHYPALSLSEARKRAHAALGLGPTPKSEPAIRFSAAVTTFLDEHYKDKKPRTRSEVQRLLSAHFKVFNNRDLTTVTDRDISIQLARIADRPSEQLHACAA